LQKAWREKETQNLTSEASFFLTIWDIYKVTSAVTDAKAVHPSSQPEETHTWAVSGSGRNVSIGCIRLRWSA
jgi:hypothetical protein